ncbi:MAG: HAD family hydrolase [Oscillospiraceae bacterium]|nr:HAD family hydrolase [Oscillospiraceae bacterium]
MLNNSNTRGTNVNANSDAGHSAGSACFSKIIFDMDGVITGESMYWDAAALTVCELLFGRENVDASDIDGVHDTVFCGRDMINALKVRGVNTNWDLALVTYCISKHIDPDLQKLDKEHFKKVLEFAQSLPYDATEVYDISYNAAARVTGRDVSYFVREKGEFWGIVQDVFAYWFVETGLYAMEKPCVPLEKLRGLLETLKARGIVLGIGTGRPDGELKRPLEMWDIEEYFDKASIGSYTDTVNAEIACKSEVSLAKPHPYVFLKAAAGGRYTDKEILAGSHDNITDGVLVVGDAAADFVSAKAGGFAFAAVLTGVSGADMRGYFEENGAEYIFDDVMGLRELFLN